MLETVVDDWLRTDLLVDLYAVVRQGLQVGEESYSLKQLERHHAFERKEQSVREGGGSIIAYESWLETRRRDAARVDPRLQRGGLRVDRLAASPGSSMRCGPRPRCSTASTSPSCATPADDGDVRRAEVAAGRCSR